MAGGPSLLVVFLTKLVIKMSEMQPILDEEQATEFNNLLRKALDKYPMFMEIFHQLGRKSITTLEIYDYLLSVDRPVSALEIQSFGCPISRKNIYRTIKKLRSLGLVAYAGRRTRNTKREFVWVAV